MSETYLQEPRFPLRFARNVEADGLRQEIARLKTLVVQLSEIVAKRVVAEK
jgi:hypothetical protein